MSAVRKEVIGAFLRTAFLPSREIGRVERHLPSLDLNDLWNWAYVHPETLSGPFPVDRPL